MKNIYIVIASLVLGLGLKAQQLPHYTNYKFNQFVLNPALAGFKDCLDINFGYRTQWVGFEGAPRTGFFAANAKLGKSTELRKHGIGGVIETDQTNPFSRTNFNLAYSYQFKFKKDLNGSFGLFAGFSQYKFDNALINVPNQDLDPILNRGSQSAFIVPEITPGFWMYNSRFYLGLSVKSLIGNKLKKIGEEAKLVQHMFLTSGKAYEVGTNTLLIPSGMISYAPGAFPSINLNLMLDYKQLIAGGVAVRNGDSVSALLRFRFFNNFTLSYAYDYTLSPLRLASANTHEISLNIYACPGKFYSGKIPCAAYN